MSTSAGDLDKSQAVHYLDVAFSSDAKPAFGTEGTEITMAYGFTYEYGYKSGMFHPDGQMSETLVRNQDFCFNIIDTAERPATIDRILITFDEKGSPFPWSSREFPKDEKLPDRTPVGKHNSTGCGVSGTGWVCGPYKAVNLGDFECTIKVDVTTADGKKKIFSVDPEMIVKGG